MEAGVRGKEQKERSERERERESNGVEGDGRDRMERRVTAKQGDPSEPRGETIRATKERKERNQEEERNEAECPTGGVVGVGGSFEILMP